MASSRDQVLARRSFLCCRLYWDQMRCLWYQRNFKPLKVSHCRRFCLIQWQFQRTLRVVFTLRHCLFFLLNCCNRLEDLYLPIMSLVTLELSSFNHQREFRCDARMVKSLWAGHCRYLTLFCWRWLVIVIYRALASCRLYAFGNLLQLILCPSLRRLQCFFCRDCLIPALL